MDEEDDDGRKLAEDDDDEVDDDDLRPVISDGRFFLGDPIPIPVPKDENTDDEDDVSDMTLVESSSPIAQDVKDDER